jgi:cyclohexadieny/prephenate dehydrogenase
MQIEQLTIIGVGLIGGSVGLAAKTRGVARRVVGVDHNAESLKKAEARGAIDSGTGELAEGVRDANLVVVCTPVDRIADTLLALVPHAKPGTILTDAGSTKQNILMGLARRLPSHLPYVPAHPLAGSEKAGPEHSRADLFENRTTVLVVGSLAADWDSTAAVGRFWESLGSRVVLMNADEHDKVLAVTSHLPHAVASAVAGVTLQDWLNLTAGGFRDVTRIAAGDPKMWAAIFQANKGSVLSALTAFTDRLNEFRKLLESGDRAGIERWLSEGKQVRDALGT